MKAMWKGQVLAESNDMVTVEGNAYFPAASINERYFEDSDTTSVCPWKGTASYKSITVDGETNKDAAWYYREPKEAASEIAGRYAFWKGVEVSA